MAISKKQLVAKISETYDIQKTAAERAVDMVFDQIAGILESGEAVMIPGFGLFTLSRRDERSMKDPSGEEHLVPAHNTVRFRPAKRLKEAVY